MSNPPKEISSTYDPASVEQRIYQYWTDNNYFSPTIDNTKSPFVIIMPPPNVTGQLHLGHALTATIEDILVRWHRMLGDPTLWVPGKDHAGIATQVTVEKQLRLEGKTRHEIGREEFLERVWEAVTEYGSTIDQQHKRLGASCDWSRIRFTLDPSPSLAVRTTFINLYKKNLIYRKEGIINWCIRCSTALSDLEVIHEETEGYIYYIKYPISNKDSITVATTRPETMLGDTGVAVNPKDRRYKDIIGKEALLPLVGRKIPIISDALINPEFGTGALKVTPAHDPIDFQIGENNSLDVITVINNDGHILDDTGQYNGLERFEARELIVEQLEIQGFLAKKEQYTHSIGYCQRCMTIVEPLITKQWFVKVKPLAKPALEAVKKGDIRIVPERFTRVYVNWLDNIRDWCISRQIWWGHRIPVWYCGNCDHITVPQDDPDLCESCGSSDISQDTDVLDTWFSSALWPHSTLGWPEKTADLDYFYPNSVIETGYDILFFWVARMIMLGIENMGSPPFHTIYLHGLIRDAKGAKMSKTKGNVLDPIELIDLYGTDALRFSLTKGTTPGNDIRIDESKIAASRNFVNKIWNTGRYVMTNLNNQHELNDWETIGSINNVEDRWILSRLNQVIGNVNNYLERFEIGEAQKEIYDFLWGEFCDWYIEISKIRIRNNSQDSPITILIHVFEKTLRLLHIFIPFVTEELWTQLTNYLPNKSYASKTIMLASYPTIDESRIDIEAEDAISKIIDIVRSIRNVRAQLRVEASKKIDVLIQPGKSRQLIEDEHQTICSMAKIDNLMLVDNIGNVEKNGIVVIVINDIIVGLRLGEMMDLSKERVRLENELNQTTINLERVKNLISDPNFANRAPDEVVAQETAKVSLLLDRSNNLTNILSQLPE